MKKIIAKIRNPKIFQPLAGVIVALIIIFSFIYLQKTMSRVFIEDSQVLAPIVTISSSSTGKLQEMDAYEGYRVKKGDVMGVVGAETVRTDTDGLVIMANNQIGSVITPQTPLVQMIHPTDLRVVGTLDENKGLNTVHVGQVASFTIDALPGKTFWGYVDEVSPTAKQTQLSFSISTERPTQQFQIYARFDSEKYPEIKNGMSAKMTIFTDTK